MMPKCRIVKAGMGTINFKLLILCRQQNMPKSVPGAPPNKAISRRVLSGIRQRFFFALRLSIDIEKNPAKHIKI